MKDSLLRFEDIQFAYSPAGKQVIKNLSLTVEENTITAIFGPNGSGKTTLLYLALGWLKPVCRADKTGWQSALNLHPPGTGTVAGPGSAK